MIKQLERQVDGLLDWGGLTPVDTTGPVFLSRIWEEHPRLFKDVVVYPSVRKARLDCFVPLSDASDLVAKTGSGQTCMGKVETQGVFCRAFSTLLWMTIANIVS